MYVWKSDDLRGPLTWRVVCTGVLFFPSKRAEARGREARRSAPRIHIERRSSILPASTSKPAESDTGCLVSKTGNNIQFLSSIIPAPKRLAFHIVRTSQFRCSFSLISDSFCLRCSRNSSVRLSSILWRHCSTSLEFRTSKQNHDDRNKDGEQ